MRDEVLVESREELATVTLNRPAKLNAWTAGTRSELIELLTALARDDSIRAVVITGAGRGFCAGQDLAETAAFDPTDHRAAEEWINGFEALYRAVRSLPKPVVAAINGVAAGSGFQFALLADLRIGHAGVQMGQPEVRSGLPSITGIWAMWSILGRAKTTELALTGELVDAAEAARLGLLTKVVAECEVLPVAQQLASKLAGLPSGAVRLTKRRLCELEDAAFAEAFAAARQIHEEAYVTGEPQAQMKQFLSRATNR